MDTGLGQQFIPDDNLYMVLPGTTAYLPCRGVAKPNVTAVKWYKNGAEVNRTSGRISSGTVDQPSLTISNVTKEDEGFYRCNATTKQGKTSETTLLVVLSKFTTVRILIRQHVMRRFALVFIQITQIL